MSIILPGHNGKSSEDPNLHQKLDHLRMENIQMTKVLQILSANVADLRKRVKRLEKDGCKQG